MPQTDPIKELPIIIRYRLEDYMERIGEIKWFQPKKVNKERIGRQVRFALSGFGLTAEIEYRDLKSPKDWDAARDAAWGAAWGAARDAAWDAARDAAWGAAEIVASDLPEYRKKYPNGSFANLIPLWEAGLYPVGIVRGKFVIYVPEVSNTTQI